MSDYEDAIALAETVLALMGGSTPPRQLALAILDGVRHREHLRIKDEQIVGLRAKLEGKGHGIARAEKAIGRRNEQNAALGQEIERLKAKITELAAILADGAIGA